MSATEEGFGLKNFLSYAFEHVLDLPMEEAVKRVYDFNGSEHEHIRTY